MNLSTLPTTKVITLLKWVILFLLSLALLTMSILIYVNPSLAMHIKKDSTGHYINQTIDILEYLGTPEVAQNYQLERVILEFSDATGDEQLTAHCYKGLSCTTVRSWLEKIGSDLGIR